MFTKLPFGFQLTIQKKPVEFANSNKLDNKSIVLSDNSTDLYFILNNTKQELLSLGIISVYQLFLYSKIKCKISWPNKLYANKQVAQINLLGNILEIKIMHVTQNIKQIITTLCEEINFNLHKIQILDLSEISEILNKIPQKNDYIIINGKNFMIQNIDKNMNLNIISNNYYKSKIKLMDILNCKVNTSNIEEYIINERKNN